MEQKIKNYIKEHEINVSDYDLEDIERLSYELEDILPFNLYVRGSNGGSDYWLQCEYYSDKIMKTIVWDYDYMSSFDGEQEFIDVLCNTAKEIEAFESRLSLSKK